MIGPGSIGLSIGMFSDYGSINRQKSRYTIQGTTLNAAGQPIGNCMVTVFETVSNLYRGGTVSGASDGKYEVEIVGDRSLTFYAMAYLPGSPDVVGMTVNTLVAVPETT